MSSPLLVFDLDDTLVDWSDRSRHARETVAHFLAEQSGGSPASWLDAILEPDGDLWHQVISGAMPHGELAATRMRRILASRGREEAELVEEAVRRYHAAMVERARIEQATLELLAELNRRYTVHLLTNGLAEFQWLTLRGLALEPYFDRIYICSDLRCYKPDPTVFRHVLGEAGARPEEAWMIGDSWQDDMVPALELGMTTAWVNPERQPVPGELRPHHDLASVLELGGLLLEREGVPCDR